MAGCEAHQRAAAALLGLVLAAFSAGDARSAQERSNVLLITFDDMHWESVGVYGSKVPDATPNIDRFAAQGLRFEHAHVAAAICQASRAVWMTGRYPHRSGALGFTSIGASIPTLPETLKAHGYLTGIIGKTEHVLPSREAAFEYRRSRAELRDGRSPYQYGIFAREFFAKAKASAKPFFLMVNTYDPHRPFDSGKAPGIRRYAPRTASENAGKSPPPDDPAPSRVYKRDEVVVPGFLPDLPPIRWEVARYQSSVRRADDVVGVVLDALAQMGFFENTIVLLMSDHGMSMPFAKANVWRNSTRTPWIVRWPGVVEPAGHDTNYLVSGVDLTPTILDALGIPPLPDTDGRSLVPILQGGKQEDREYVFTQIDIIAFNVAYPMRSLQNARYGYIWNAWSDGKTVYRNETTTTPTWRAMVAAARNDPALAARLEFFSLRVPEEFYDYEADPDALVNRIDDPALQDTIRDFRERLRETMTRGEDPRLEDFEKWLTRDAPGPAGDAGRGTRLARPVSQ